MRGAPLAGENRLGDRNYARGPAFRRFLASGSGKADFIERVGWNALRLTRPDDVSIRCQRGASGDREVGSTPTSSSL